MAASASSLARAAREAAPLGALRGVAARIARWRGGRTGVAVALPCPVVSVGSLVAGSPSVTPAAAWLARALQARGHRVALLAPGRRGSGVVLASDGRFVRAGRRRVGEIALGLAAHAPGIPVLAGRDRVRAGRRAIATLGAEILVACDAFQHLALARTLDWVAFDAEPGFGNGRCAPAGPLRETPEALAGIDLLGVVDGPLREADAHRIEAVAPGARRCALHLAARSLVPLGGGEARAAHALEGQRVGIVARPSHIPALARAVALDGAQVATVRPLPRGRRGRRAEAAGLAAEASRWVTSEFDAARLPVSWVGAAEVQVLSLGIEVEDGAALVDWIEARLR